MAGGPVSTRALRRSTIVGILILAVFAALMIRVLIIQTVNFDQYQSKVINQMTTESSVPADRGKIYDCNGNVLATNITTYRVFISPSGIQSAQQEADATEGSKANYARLISQGLAQILGVSEEDVFKQTKYTAYLDRTIKRKVDETTADRVQEFITENKLGTMVYMEAQSTRYYPNGTLACHMLGFTSNDGVGLYGLEYQYDEYLKGVDGYYIKARDSYGNEMPYDYASYIDAIDGYHLKTTIDTSIQNFLEEELERSATNHKVQNRVCGIVMDIKTGGILAMANSSPFDLNDPWALDEKSQQTLLTSGYSQGTDEYDNLQRDLLTAMWSNKAVIESYIPGSTFKIITSSMALEEKLVSLGESVTCNGHLTYYGHRIHCHQRKGHGALSFPEGLQQSCNVWFMTLGERIGVERYNEYVEAFGYKEKTGIDLPGEASSIFASQMTDLDLVIYAFGQNFNVTPIQQITAVSAVANGGNLMKPYIVEQITDNAGNVIYQHNIEVKRQTISTETCETISKMLEEGVSGNGGAKNAYVAGYRVAAKTGTSEKKNVGDEDLYICSTVAYAPADDPQVAIIIIADEPTKGAYGSTVAAPYVANALGKIMPYLGVTPEYTDVELTKLAMTVGSYRGSTVSRAVERLSELGVDYEIIGNGDTVKSQRPSAGTKVERSSAKIYLYTDTASPEATVTVPDLTGKIAASANATLINLGLNVKIEGTPQYLYGTEVEVYSQSVEPGTKVSKGSVITLYFRAPETPDYTPNDT